MYPNSPTETERMNKYIDEEAVSANDVIDYYITHFNTKPYEQGLRYYMGENDVIMNRVLYTWDDNQEKWVVDQEATNNKVPSGWHKLLVDQKVSYLVGKPITIDSKSGDEKGLETINEILGEQFDDVLPELVKGASNKGREWLHPYIDESGMFDYMVIPAQQGIPIYDNSKEKKLEGFIRFYSLEDDVIKIEVWDKNQVTFYEKVHNKVVLDVNYDVNPQPHFSYGEEGYGWGEVPFIEFKNNEEVVSDLTFYKEQIDLYDILTCDAANSLQDVQDFAYVFKGDMGIDHTVKQMVTSIKRKKGINVSGEGNIGVDTLQGEVPNQALNDYLERLVEDIYNNGQGVNNSPDKFGNAPSGVALKNLYSSLNMKCNVLERKFARALEKFMWFVTEYLSMSGQGDVDHKDIKFTFNKTMLMNEKEQTEMAQNSKGVISDKTIIANHPWVTDVDEEMKQLEEQQESVVDLNTPIDGDE